MANLPSSGPLSIQQIGTFFGDTSPHAMNEFYRGGPLVPNIPANASIPTSGQIAVGNFYNASDGRQLITLTVAGTTNTNYNVYTAASASPLYVAGFSDVVLNIQSGAQISSTSTSTAALLVPNAFNPGDTVTINNQGVVAGRGGNGGNGGPGAPGSAPTMAGGSGGAGGLALEVQRPVTIDNSGGVIRGGGGGGGGGGGAFTPAFGPPKSPTPAASVIGGGGGGGATGNPGASPLVTSTGGSPNGNPGANDAAGSGGPGTTNAPRGITSGAGGAGGAAGSAGTSGSPAPAGPIRGAGGAGGSAGGAVSGNPFITWTNTGTRTGPIS
jgi:hypothetical protein